MMLGIMKLSPAQRDRAAGALVGLAAADALGGPYEFGPPLTDRPVMHAGRGWDLGEWTDDTAMALAIATTGASGELDAEEVAASFLSWLGSGPKDVGIQTRQVLRAASGDPTRVAACATEYFRRNPDRSAGNGSLMRTAPVALSYLGDDGAIAQAAREISDLTHADPVAGEACVLWSIGIDRAVREGRTDGVRDGLALLDRAASASWEALLDEAERKVPSEFPKNGWVVQALQGAWSAIAHADGVTGPERLRSGIEMAVAGGHDADTVGAIAGGLLGAAYGASAVPWEWKERLHGWPDLRIRGLVGLSQLIVGGGKPGQAGYPTAESMKAYYQHHDHPAGIAVPLPDDPGLLIGDVKGLEGAGGDADVVVSLCRMGTNEVRSGVEHIEIWLMDSSDPADNPNLGFVFADTADLIARRRADGKTVFLHCVRAERRTPAMVAAYLVPNIGVGAAEAVDKVRHALETSLDPYPSWIIALESLEGGLS